MDHLDTTILNCLVFICNIHFKNMRTCPEFWGNMWVLAIRLYIFRQNVFQITQLKETGTGMQDFLLVNNK